MAVVQLGGGRKVATDSIDYSVGISDICKLGDKIDAETPVAVIHANDDGTWEQAAAMLREAIQLSDSKPDENPCVYQRIV